MKKIFASFIVGIALISVADYSHAMASVPVRTPGAFVDNPLMPNQEVESGFGFQFTSYSSRPVYIDPIVAVGYDYIVNSGPNIATVLLPVLGDNSYNLWLKDSSGNWENSGNNLTGGIEYAFGGSGVNQFRISGIETDLNLDPANSRAFVTGLTFVESGTVNMQQIPVTFDTGGPQAVPVPATMLLLGGGLAGLAGSRLKRKKQEDQ